MRLVLTSYVLHGGMRDLVLHCLAIKLLIWTVVAAAASGCFCQVLIVALILTCSHPLKVRSFHPLWVRSFEFFFTLVLVKAAGNSRCFRLTVAPWRTVRSRTFLHVLRVASWTDRHHAVSSSFAFTSLSCLGPLAEGLSADTIVAVSA